ncbi:MAG: PorT family protein [Bacteroidetes bacterium]|nr:PorT family protein [Bacteroidota bacterium]
MNKIVTSAAILLTSIGTFMAQESENRENLKFGLKAGINYSNVYDERGDEFVADPTVGFAGGAFIGIPVGKFLGIQPEIIYSQKGFEGSGQFLGSPYNFKRTTTYVDVPIQVQLKVSEYLTFLAGPQYSYLISQRDVFESTSSSYEQEKEFENDNVQKNIFGFVGGLDIYIHKLTLSGRVGWDVSHNHGDGSSSTPRYKNNWFQATVGFSL